MTYEVIKYIKGNPYRYLVKSVREGDRVRQVFVRYLGRADKPSREYLETEPVERKERIRRPAVAAVSEAVTPTEVKPSVTPEVTIPRGIRPDLYVADIEGMMPETANRVKTVQLPDGSELAIMSDEGDIYGLIDGKEVGFATKLSDTETDLSVVMEYRNKGIGTELMRQFQIENPEHPTGGLTEGGKRVIERLAEIQPITPTEAVTPTVAVEAETPSPPVALEVAEISTKLAGIDLPNVKVSGSYATETATPASDIDLLVGIPDNQWNRITLYKYPKVIQTLYDTLPEDRMSIHLYKISKPNELWHFQRPRVEGGHHLSGVFVPVDYSEDMIKGLWSKAVTPTVIPKAEAVMPEVTKDAEARRERMRRDLMVQEDAIKQEILKEIRSYQPMGKMSEIGEVLGVHPSKGQVISTPFGSYVFAKARLPDVAITKKWETRYKEAEELGRRAAAEFSFMIVEPGLTTGNIRGLEQGRKLKAQGLLSPRELKHLDALEEFWAKYPDADYGVVQPDGSIKPSTRFKKVAPVTPEVTKEPWQMTREKYLDLQWKDRAEFQRLAQKPTRAGSSYAASLRLTEESLTTTHKRLIEQALSEGKPVPAEVLKDYPDLVKQAGVTPAPEVAVSLETSNFATRQGLSRIFGATTRVRTADFWAKYDALSARLAKLRTGTPTWKSVKSDFDAIQAHIEREGISREPAIPKAEAVKPFTERVVIRESIGEPKEYVLTVGNWAAPTWREVFATKKEADIVRRKIKDGTYFEEIASKIRESQLTYPATQVGAEARAKAEGISISEASRLNAEEALKIPEVTPVTPRVIRKTYIRIGDLPEGGKSEISGTGKLERGISSYEATYDIATKKYYIDATEANVDDLAEFMDWIEIGKKKVFELEGREIGKGSTGEPLLDTPKIKRPISPSNVIIKKPDGSGVTLSKKKVAIPKAEAAPVTPEVKLYKTTKGFEEDAILREDLETKQGYKLYAVFENQQDAKTASEKLVGQDIKFVKHISTTGIETFEVYSKSKTITPTAPAVEPIPKAEVTPSDIVEFSQIKSPKEYQDWIQKQNVDLPYANFLRDIGKITEDPKYNYKEDEEVWLNEVGRNQIIKKAIQAHDSGIIDKAELQGFIDEFYEKQELTIDELIGYHKGTYKPSAIPQADKPMSTEEMDTIMDEYFTVKPSAIPAVEPTVTEVTKTYIRIGDLPERGKSEIEGTGKFEKGVSAYEAQYDPATKKHYIEATEDNVDDLAELMDWIESGKKKVFELSGKEIGLGATGEPLLTTATIKRTISPDDVIIKKPDGSGVTLSNKKVAIPKAEVKPETKTVTEPLLIEPAISEPIVKEPEIKEPTASVTPEVTIQRQKQALIDYWTKQGIGKAIKPETWDEIYIRTEYEILPIEAKIPALPKAESGIN